MRFLPGAFLRRPRVRRFLWALAAGTAAAGAAWMLLPWFVEDPLPVLVNRPVTRLVTDRTGRPLSLERPDDLTWRFPVPLAAVAPDAVRVLLAVEDADFRRHGGVDYLAAARAAWQNLTSFRVVSGASTIDMQVAGLAVPSRHNLWGKMLQAARARKLDGLHGKDAILEAYLNNLPFGGKVVGIEAAARYYFGVTAAELTLGEAAWLGGIPQRPNHYRPDRHPERLRPRFERVVSMLVRAGVVTAEGAARLLAAPPRFRDFRVPAFRPPVDARAFRYPIERLLAAHDGESLKDTTRPAPTNHESRTTNHALVSSLDADFTATVRGILARRRDALRNVHDAAAVLVRNATGEVVAYVGTLDFDAPGDGQVDALRATRCAGSVLKPFLYAEAFAGGLCVPDTVLEDAPVRYGAYSPGNYDGTFAGRVTAEEALSRSLNTPAIKLVALLGTNRVETLFRTLGLVAATKPNAGGLALALGCEGHRPLDLAAAATVFGTGGLLRPLRFDCAAAATVFGTGGLLRPLRFDCAAAATNRESRTTNHESRTTNHVFAPGVCSLIARCLRLRSLPGTGLPIAWKTGTSNNLRDAWCLAFTPDWTLVVWFGNKDGRRSEDLVGVVAAAPAAGEIMAALYGRTIPVWTDPGCEERDLCAATGLAPSPVCTNRVRRLTAEGIPLQVCSACRQTAPDRPPRIIEPAPKDYRVAPGQATVRLSLRTGGEEADWYWNGRHLGRWSGAREFEFPPGDHEISILAGVRGDTLRFRVAFRE